MKLYFKIGIVFLLGILLWALFQNKTEEKSKINTVTFKTNHEKTQTAHEKNKNHKTVKIIHQINDNISKQDKTQLAESIKMLTYIELYDKYLNLFNCLGYVERVRMKAYELENNANANKEIDFIQEYKDKITLYSNARQQQATDKQIHYYQEYINNCEYTITQVESIFNEEELKSNDVYYPISKLLELMEQKKPQSDEGKTLKSTIANVKRLTTSLNELEKIKKGKPTVSQEEIWKIEGKIEKLRWEVAGLKQVPDDERDEQSLKILQEEYKQQKTYLASLYEYDEQGFMDKIVEFNFVKKETEKNLHAKYPRVFYEAFAGLNFSHKDNNKLPDYYARERYKNLGVGIKAQSELIKDKTSIKEDAYFNQLLQPALDLYLCYLGQDCQLPLNRHLASYCYIPQVGFLNSNTGMYFESCDMGLEEFYLEHYLTENQVEDLDLIFDYLVETYAK